MLTAQQQPKRAWSAAVGVAAGLRRHAVPTVALGLCAILLFTAQHLTKTLDYHAVIGSLRGLPPGLLVRSLLATAVSYLALVGRDAVALRAIGVKLPRSLLWIAAVAGSALGNAVGFGALTGGAVRYRIYGAAGINAAQVVRLGVLTSAIFAFGLVVLSGLGLACAAPAMGAMLRVPPAVLHGGGLALLAGGATLMAWCHPGRASTQLGRISLAMPTRGFLGA